MKGFVLALGVGLSTLGLADTASAAGPPRGGNGGYNRSYSNYNRGHSNYNRGYSNYNREYSNYNRGFQPSFGYRSYSPFQSYGYPAYDYSGMGYRRPVFSFGLSFIR